MRFVAGFAANIVKKYPRDTRNGRFVSFAKTKWSHKKATELSQWLVCDSNSKLPCK